jgi:hypothetical protein
MRSVIFPGACLADLQFEFRIDQIQLFFGPDEGQAQILIGLNRNSSGTG